MQLIHRIPLRDIAQVLSGIPLGRIKNPMTKTLRLKSEEGIKQYLRMGKGYGINVNGIITIPVVAHIIHDSGENEMGRQNSSNM
jgi:hypothetical protein